MKHRLPRKIKKQIPKNTPYCYTWDKNGNYKSCPLQFWNKLDYLDCRYLVKTFGQLNGELGKNNDDLDFCLNDSCKSCGFSGGKY